MFSSRMIATRHYFSVQAWPTCSRGGREAGSRRFAEKMRLTPSYYNLSAARLDLDQPQDDFAVAVAGPAHGPHAVDHRRLDLDEALLDGKDRSCAHSFRTGRRAGRAATGRLDPFAVRRAKGRYLRIAVVIISANECLFRPVA